jgi:hypothetical protein
MRQLWPVLRSTLGGMDSPNCFVLPATHASLVALFFFRAMRTDLDERRRGAFLVFSKSARMAFSVRQGLFIEERLSSVKIENKSCLILSVSALPDVGRKNPAIFPRRVTMIGSSCLSRLVAESTNCRTVVILMWPPRGHSLARQTFAINSRLRMCHAPVVAGAEIDFERN